MRARPERARVRACVCDRDARLVRGIGGAYIGNVTRHLPSALELIVVCIPSVHATMYEPCLVECAEATTPSKTPAPTNFLRTLRPTKGSAMSFGDVSSVAPCAAGVLPSAAAG